MQWLISPLQVTKVELLNEFLESLLWRDNITAVVESWAQDNVLLHQLKHTEKWGKTSFEIISKISSKSPIETKYAGETETHPTLNVEYEGEGVVTEAGVRGFPAGQWGHPTWPSYCRGAWGGEGFGLSFRSGLIISHINIHLINLLLPVWSSSYKCNSSECFEF